MSGQMTIRQPNSSSQRRKSKCGENVPGFLCAACLCCFSPLIALWCCIKLPFKAARQCAYGCGAAKKTGYASESTASDIELDKLSGKPRTCSMRGAPRAKMTHIDMTNQPESNRGQQS